MNTWMSLRRLAPAALLSAGLLPAAGQEAQADSPKIVADAWSRKIIQTMRTHDRRDEAGSLVALQPLYPSVFSMLTARQRRQLYEWLLRAFREAALDYYSLVDRERLRDISRVLEETGAADWDERYRAVLDNTSTRINIICTGSSVEATVELSCSASDLKGNVSLGGAPALFRLEWLNRPIAL